MAVTVTQIHSIEPRNPTIALSPSDEKAVISRHLDGCLFNTDRAIDRKLREMKLQSDCRTRFSVDVVTGISDVRMIASELPDSNPVADGDEAVPLEFNPRGLPSGHLDASLTGLLSCRCRCGARRKRRAP